MNEFLVSVGPAVGNHIWQSTAFAVAAGALAVLLKKNQAKTRYWIWLAASIKFLAPFSLLIGVGSMLPRLQHVPVVAQTAYSTMDTVSEPFAESVLPVTATYAPRNERRAMPGVIASVWLCGLVVVVLMWWRQWRRVALVVREAMEADGGREMDILRRLERDAGMRPVRLLLSRSSLEPGVFGVVRPALVWPEGISARLSGGQMEAIVAHELCHVRRRDNLFAMEQMVVEAVFWFHPLVWWMGARMVEERERACDEEVLGRGSDPEVYAESVLKICEFCLESPLACVSGITGADLKRRIVRIMSKHFGRKLSLGKKLVLVMLALMVVAGPVIFGQMSPNRGGVEIEAPKLEVVSVRKSDDNAGRTENAITPTGLSLHRMPLAAIIGNAYMNEFRGPDRIVGIPDWAKPERYDVVGKVGDADLPKLQNLNQEEGLAVKGAMLQQVLRERFGLKTHVEERELPVYALTLASGGMKMKEAKPGDTYVDGARTPGGSSPLGAGGVAFALGKEKGTLQVMGQGVTVDTLMDYLMAPAGRVVVNRTGLTGRYDFTLTYAQGPIGGPAQAGDGATEMTGPSIFTAVQEQLGLKLESMRGPVKVLVIDSIERPTPN